MARSTFDADSIVADLEKEDLIDTRDLHDALDELQRIKSDREDYEAAIKELPDGADNPEAPEEVEGLTEDQAELLELLEELEQEVSEWRHGEALISEDYFTEYAKQFAEDIGAIPDEVQWPCTFIDWEAAADNLKMDYTSIEIGGTTFYYRS